MTFSTLSSYFEKLETTSSRLSLIDILAELFKHAGKDEIEKIVYLTQGRIAPFFEPTEIGMAEKNVASAVAAAYGSTKEAVLKLYGKLGDMGLTVEQLATSVGSLTHVAGDAHQSKAKLKVNPRSLSENRHPSKINFDDKSKSIFSSPASGQASSGKISIIEVFEILTQIAKTTGEGTVEKRQNLLVELLKKLDPISAKHLVRIPLGNMRLGIGDPTILDGLAKAKLGDRSKRKLLEGAYNRTSDLGLIAKTLYEKGLPAVEKLQVQIGKPIRAELCERLPSPEKVIEKMGTVDAQLKYDGFRCVTGFTPAYVKGKGITAISSVKEEDFVLTHKGNFKKVVGKNVRIIEKGESLYRFQTYLGESFRVSEGHKIFAIKEGKKAWIPVENLKRGDEVIFPTPKFVRGNNKFLLENLTLETIDGYKKTFICDNDFYRFLGFWIGDGFTNDFHNTERIGLVFNNKKEKPLADEYEKIIREKLGVNNLTCYVHNGGLNLYWRDQPFKKWLTRNFRRDRRGKQDFIGKRLPEWFAGISKENFEYFLKGWIESDGSVGKDGITRITTKEKDLASFAQLIALSHGITVGIHEFRVKIKNYKKTYYYLVLPKGESHIKRVNDCFYVKIAKLDKITKRDPRIKLYNLQIEEDESYCVPMATLHNCQIHKDENKVTMFSRNLENMTHMFPELIEGTLKQVKAKTVILDTEALAYNPASEEFLPFQETTKRRRKHNIEETAKKLPLKAFVFDILYKDGKSLIDTPLEERIKILKHTIHEDGILISTKNQTISDPKKLSILLEDAISKGLEGVVVKRLDSKYEAGGRNFNWVKLKRNSSGELNDTIDCVILGYIFGKGKRTAFGVGALLVGVYDDKKDEFMTVSKIGTGLTDEEWQKIKAQSAKIKVQNKPARVNSLITPSVWVQPKIVIEVLADEITRSPIHTAGKTDPPDGGEPGYALRFPRLVSFRGADKKAEDATTVKELIEMYKQQGDRG